MTFTCIICGRNMPIGLGRQMSSGSWRCINVIDCVDHIPAGDQS